MITEATVPGRLASVVATNTERIAVRSPTASITYRDLADASSALADTLAHLPADPAPVVVLVAHGVPSVTAILGVAQSGRAHLVLDPRAPEAFRADAVRRHGGGVVVTDRSHLDAARAVAPGATPVVLDDLEPSAAHARLRVEPDAPCSVSYTSGTSGVPKAVVHSHRNVVANATRYAAETGVTVADVVVMTNPFAAAAALTPVFAALLTGATLATYDLATLGAAHLPAFLTRVGATIVHVPPAALTALATGTATPVPGVRLVSLGGDLLLPEAMAAARAVFPDAVLLHRYSASETFWIAGHAVAPDEPLPDGPAPLGRPVPWLTVELVDESGAPVAPGEVGEVVVTGDHLALGYLGDPERTAAKFRDGPNGRTYATGDRARCGADGVLEFVGRSDDVRKVRGVLVDLATVEGALVALPGVDTAAVVAHDRATGLGLTAFVTGPDTSPARVRADLANALPSAMVPARIVPVAELPLTPRGKVDRDALAQQAASLTEPPYAEPVGRDERAIARLVAQALALDAVGRDDDVFALGADSLALVEIRTGLEEHFGVPVTPSDLLEHPTPSRLTAFLTASRGHTTRGTVRRVVEGRDDRVPVVLFSGGGGGHLDTLALLAHRLDGRRAYVVVPHGFERRARPDRTVDAMADRVARDLVRLGAERVVLVGHSSGGNVALETARRLEPTPVAVPLVVLLDSLAITPEVIRRRKYRAWLRWEHDRWRRGPDGQAASPPRRLAWAVRFTERWIARRWLAATAGVVPRSGVRQHRAFEALLRQALLRHAERPYFGAVHLVRADDEWRNLPEDLRWSENVETLTVDRVPAPHMLMTASRYLAWTAPAVEAACRRADDPDEMR